MSHLTQACFDSEKGISNGLEMCRRCHGSEKHMMRPNTRKTMIEEEEMGMALFRSIYRSRKIAQGSVPRRKSPTNTSLQRDLRVQAQVTKGSVLPFFAFHSISSLKPTRHGCFDGMQKLLEAPHSRNKPLRTERYRVTFRLFFF